MFMNKHIGEINDNKNGNKYWSSTGKEKTISLRSIPYTIIAITVNK